MPAMPAWQPPAPRLARTQESATTWEGNLAAVEQSLQSRRTNSTISTAPGRIGPNAVAAAWRRSPHRRPAWKPATNAAPSSPTWCSGTRACPMRPAQILTGATPPPGLVGPLADRLVADEPWAGLVDLALGDHGQGLVVDSLAALVGESATWLESEAARTALSSGGRVAFLAAASLREPPAFDPEPDSEIVGRLDLLVATAATPAADDPERAALLRKLLGRVWIVETRGMAAAARRRRAERRARHDPRR